MKAKTVRCMYCGATSIWRQVGRRWMLAAPRTGAIHRCQKSRKNRRKLARERARMDEQYRQAASAQLELERAGAGAIARDEPR